MLQIIAATDFSDVATKAVNYACQLATASNASVLVVHSYIIPVTISDTPIPVMPMSDGQHIADDRMAKLINRLKETFPTLEIESKVMYGEIVDCLLDCMEVLTPWMVILGNSGSGDTGLWIGSTVVSALKNLPCPVAAIPPDAIYQPVRNICLAADYKKVSQKFPAEQLLSLVEETKATLHILHIGHNNKDLNEETIADTEAMHAALGILKPSYHFADSENIEEAIQQFVSANHIDWLAITPHRHSFWDALFHKSKTKAIAGMSHIPLIALHEKD
jgi:nucleotide-binding universal stress UspA family protein